MSGSYENLIANPQLAKRRAQYLPLVQQEAARVGVDWRYLDALIARESSYNPNAIGDNGKAVGLGQMHPATAQGLGLDPGKRTDPALAIRAAADYFAQGYKKANGDAGLAGLGYNAGHGAIKAGTTMRGTDNYRGYFEDVQKSIGGKAPTTNSVAAVVPAAAPPASAGGEIVTMRDAVKDPSAAMGAIFAAAAPKVPSYAAELSAIQNPNALQPQQEPDPSWANDMLASAAQDDAQAARSNAISSFFNEPAVPKLDIPAPIEDSINRYLARL